MFKFEKDSVLFLAFIIFSTSIGELTVYAASSNYDVESLMYGFL